jgi:hypothetical protein
MDGLDIAHMHFTQEHPEAILKMELLHAGEVAFDGALKSTSTFYPTKNPA